MSHPGAFVEVELLAEPGEPVLPATATDRRSAVLAFSRPHRCDSRFSMADTALLLKASKRKIAAERLIALHHRQRQTVTPVRPAAVVEPHVLIRRIAAEWLVS